MPAKRLIPRYLLHKSTGQARVRINNHDYYLGAYGSPESKAKYDQLIADYLAGRLPVRAKDESTPAASPPVLTVAGVLSCYLEHAERYYRKRGQPTAQVDRIGSAIRVTVARCGTLAAIAFGPKALKEVRRDMVAKGWCREQVNTCVACLVRGWRWAVSEELVPGSAAHALEAVKPLRDGEEGAVSRPKVQPVAWDAVERVLPFLRPPLRSLLTVQFLAGMRPVEACVMRSRDINQDGLLPDGSRFPGVWVYVVPPEFNKTAHRGKQRIIFLGPKAQEILSPYIAVCGPDDYLFSPAKDRPKAKGKRRPGVRYTSHAVAVAVRRACVKAGVPHWHPNRLRHAKATELRRRNGIEAAGAVLGHSHVTMTENYAQPDMTKAADAMRDVG